MGENVSNLLSIRKAMGLTQIEMCKKLSITQALYSKYETGSLVISDDVKAKLFQLGVNINWLLTGVGEMFQSPALPAPEVVSIELVGDIAAGAPFPLVQSDHKRFLSVPIGLLSRPGPYYAFQISGASMEPLLLDGDLAIISTQWSGLKLNNRIFAFRTADGITLKKLVLNPRSKSGFLFPINQVFDPLPYDKSTPDLTMIGILILSLRYYNI
jgi:SOS-response transcriptional repressor LexA